MSIEYPEIMILTSQLQSQVIGKKINKVFSNATEKLKKIGFMNSEDKNIHLIEGKTVLKVEGKGNSLVLKCSGKMNILFSPEYGGWLTYHEKDEKVLPKFHLKVDFADGSNLRFRLESMGVIYIVDDERLQKMYTYTRDFGKIPPIGSSESTLETVKTEFSHQNRQLKSVLVGKEAIVTGMSNATFQDVIYKAKIHPKRRANSLSSEEVDFLFNVITDSVNQRIIRHGKTRFIDLYGNSGQYELSMGSHMKEKTCSACGTKIIHIAQGGGQVYLCPTCQKEPMKI